MMKLSGKAVLLAAGMAAFASGEARADLITLPSPTQQAVAETLDNTGSPILVQGGKGAASAEVSDGSGNAAFAGSDLTQQSAFAQTSGSANASAFANYSFEILGSSSGSVPVFIVGSVEASVAQSGAFRPENFSILGAFATLDVGSKAVLGGEIFGAGASISHAGPGGPLVAGCGTNAGPSPDPSCVIKKSNGVDPFLFSATFSFAQEILLPENAEIDVFLTASAGPLQNGTIPPDASVQAVTDPFFQIDPTFLAANPGLSLVFSPGVENNPPGTMPPAAVPEPATLALFGAGLLGLGFLRRRIDETSRSALIVTPQRKAPRIS